MDDLLDSDKTPRRPNFTLRQLEQSSKTGFVDEAKRGRRIDMKTFPIDNLPPEQLSDRDDGIFIEVAKNGEGARIHVTIADVAAHIKAGSPLATAAERRGFTVYRDGGNSTMFPQELQDRLSLEDRQERLGLTITIDLNKYYQPIHTEFQRVLTDTYATSYTQAGSYMQSDPQFKLMANVAKGVRDNYFGDNYYTMLKEAGDVQKRIPNATQDQLAAMKLVELYMLLANNVTANFFQRSNIAFMYRNFDQGGDRAYYSTVPRGHADLEKKGLGGAYCHFTSPIRRAPDFFDQHQAHFVMDTLEAAEAGLLKIDPSLNRAEVHRLLWDNQQNLLATVAHISTEIKPIEEVLRTILSDLSSTVPEANLREPLRELTCILASNMPPYTAHELASSADVINGLMKVERREANKIAKNEEAVQTALRRLDSVREKTIGDKTPIDFSVLLHDAALTGILPKALLEETHKRMNGANMHEYALNPARDGLQIMIMAAYPDDPSWRSLKKGMARLIKHNPGAVNNILELAVRTPGALNKDLLLQANASFPTMESDTSPYHAQMQCALRTYQSDPGSPLMSAPYYSIGHDPRAAVSHANYSFLEHYAFGQLRPVDQISVPNLLYAELDSATKSRRLVVQQMADMIGAQMELHSKRIAPDTFRATLTLSGGALHHPIVIEDDEPDIGTAENTALHKLLRDDRFKNATSFMSMGDMQRLLNPHRTLQRLADESDGIFEMATHEIPSRNRAPMQVMATLNITLPPTTGVAPIVITQTATGPNKDRAIREAANLILLELEKQHVIPEAPHAVEDEPHVGSWVNAIQNEGLRSPSQAASRSK